MSEIIRCNVCDAERLIREQKRRDQEEQIAAAISQARSEAPQGIMKS